jgi:predicted GIY-YIG superfamily endonuclease
MNYYVYVLKSETDNMWYTVYTADLRNRLSLHNEGKVESQKIDGH